MKVELKQNSDEWLQFRKEKIGASDAPTIMGSNPYKTPIELYYEKIDPLFVSTGNKFTEHGKKYEETARQWAENELGMTFFPEVHIHKSHPWMMASLDGISDDGVILEVKCPYSATRHEDFMSHTSVPDYYFPQLQHQMAVMDVSKCYIVSWHADFGGCLKEVERDDEYIKKMLEEEQIFWYCLDNKIPPKQTDNDSSLETLLCEYASICDKMGPYEEQKKLIKEQIEKLSHGEKFKCPQGSISWAERKGSVDYKSIPELKDVDLEAYRKQSQIVCTIRLN